MPLLAWGAATLFQLPEDLRIGVIFVGCVPGAMASNVLTIIARGNVSYSVGLTTLATLLSPIVVPLAIKVTLGADADPQLLLNTAYQLCWQVVGPVVAGFTLCQVSRRCRAAACFGAETLANLAILWIIAVVVGMNRDRLTILPMNVLLALLSLNVCGYLAGDLAATLFRLTPGMRRALVIEVGMQNAGLGASLATLIFVDRPEVSLPSGLYTFGCMLTGTLLANWYRSRPLPAAQQA
jgi:BASS family bile acid:Na+ symporter